MNGFKKAGIVGNSYFSLEEENIIVPFTYYYGYVANIKTENGDIYP